MKTYVAEHVGGVVTHTFFRVTALLIIRLFINEGSGFFHAITFIIAIFLEESFTSKNILNTC